jgi:mannose-1-phosphate guanylyltransferase
MTSNYYAIIMAGGGGTRLWPMSRKNKPKQLLPLIDDRTMFKTSVERLAPLFAPDHIYVVTGPQYVEAMLENAPEIPAENFIVEPYGRNTAPAAGLGVSVIYKRDPNAVVVLLTADHHIGKDQDFRDLLAAAYDMALQDYIVTLGISPSHPSTGFGYIHQGEQLRRLDKFDCYEALGFTEKPNAITAAKFLTSGQYSWNSGMFIWKAEQALSEFKRQQEKMHSLFQELIQVVGTEGYEESLSRIWEEMPSESIDVAIMEGAEKMAVIPADIGWSDIGSWAALFDVNELDGAGNCFKGADQELIILDTKNTLVYSGRLTVTIGVEDIIVIDTEDALLICHKDRSQDVREVVGHLKKNKKDDYL